MKASCAVPNRDARNFLIFAAAAALLAVQTCVRIEILNVRAGGILPNREYRSDTGTPVKWRAALWTNEARWRQMRGPHGLDGMPEDRALTPEETARMNVDIRREVANNQLRDLVRTWGLAQYVLVPVAILLAIKAIFHPFARRKHRVIAFVLLGAAFICGGMTLYRSYFLSLGW